MEHINMSYHKSTPIEQTLNAYPIIIPAGTVFTYRIWTVDPIPATDKLREKIRSQLWRTFLRRPVSSTYVGDTFAFAVAEWGKQEAVEYIGEGEKRYTINPTGDLRTVDVNQVDSSEIDLAAAMLQQEFVLHLRMNQNLLRGHVNNQFLIASPDQPFSTRPQTPARSSTNVDIYRGFNFRVAHISGIGFCLVFDILTTYLGRNTLADYLSRNQRPQDIDYQNGLSRWAYDYGRVKQSVYLVNEQKKSIEDVVLRDGRTVYQYLKETKPEVANRISPTDQAVNIIYRAEDARDESKYYTAAASLLRPKFTTQSASVRALGDTPAFPPAERLRRIEAARQYFLGVRFAGTNIQIKEAVTSPETLLPLPDLVFGSTDKANSLPARQAQNDRDIRRNLGTTKMSALEQQGPHIETKIINPVLVYPASLEADDLIDEFIEQTRQFCSKYGKLQFSPTTSSYLDSSHPRDIINKVKGIVARQQTNFILLALPKRSDHADQVYAGVKTQISVPSKCFSSYKLLNFRQNPQKFSTYIDRNALGILVEAGVRPWGLGTSLNYELQFGFDVSRMRNGGLMGASVVTGATACDITFGYKEIDTAEKIPTKIIGAFILEQLEKFLEAYGRAPKGVLFQRDGRLFESERKGIKIAMARFLKANPQQPSPTWVSVSIEKTTSIPLRIFRRERKLINRPWSGSYFVQDNNVGYVILAGEPSLRQGSPRPIRVEIVDTDSNSLISVNNILEDIFWLSRLNWNSPDIDIRLPITLRFTDQKLERYSLELENENNEEADEWEMPESEPDED